jgi:hypothetical protein
MLAQAWIVLGLNWVLSEFGFGILPALLHSAAVLAVVVGASLFWATRLDGAGATGLATFATALAVGPWLFADPVAPRVSAGGGAWLPGSELLLDSLSASAKLLAVAAFLALTARRRLAHTALLLR